MQSGSGGPADKKGSVEPSARHFPAQFLHLEKRRGDESAHGNDICIFPVCSFKDSLPVDHHSNVHNIEPVAGQYDACDILSYVMDISLDGGKYDLGPGCAPSSRPVSFAIGCFSLVSRHVRLKYRYCIPHDLGGFDYLGKEHFSASEKFSDLFHPVHQRTFDNGYGTSSIFLQCLLQVFLQI